MTELDRTTTLNDIKQLVTDFFERRPSMAGYNKEPLFTEMGLVLEAAEVLECAKYGLPIEDELVDALTFLVALAITNNIDLTTALIAKLQLNEERFPPDKFTGIAEDFPRQYMQRKRDLKER